MIKLNTLLILAFMSAFMSTSIVMAETPSWLKTITVSEDPNDIVVSSNGKKAYVANRGDKNVSVVDLENMLLLDNIDEGYPRGLALSPDGHYIYIPGYSSGNATVSFVNTTTNTVEKKLTYAVTDSDYPRFMACSPDGSTVYAAGSYSLSVIDVSSKSVVKSINFDNLIKDIALSPDGNNLYLSAHGSYVGYIYVLDTSAYSVKDVGVEEACQGLSVSPDGKHVYVAHNTRGKVTVINAETNTWEREINVSGDPVDVVPSPDDKHLYVVTYSNRTVYAIDLSTDTSYWDYEFSMYSLNMTISPDGSKIFLSAAPNKDDKPGRLYVFDTGRVVDVVTPNDDAAAVTISFDKTRYYSGDSQTVTVTLSGNQAVDAYLVIVYPDGSFYCIDSSLQFAIPNSVQAIVSNWVIVPGSYPLGINLSKISEGQYTWYCILTSPDSSPIDSANWLTYSSKSFTVTDF